MIDLQQREAAAREFRRSVVVTAGAGTGKTSLLVERLLHLILERSIAIERIAAMTFTDKAAGEMRDRLTEALEEAVLLLAEGGAGAAGETEAGRVLPRLAGLPAAELRRRALEALESLDAASIGTIHGFASDLLQRHPQESGVDARYEVDKGTAGADLFDELWGEFLEHELGPAASPRLDAWERLLALLDLETIEEAARQLAEFRFSPELLAAEREGRQEQVLRRLCGDALDDLRSLAEELRGIEGLNPNVAPTLETLLFCFESGARDGKTTSGESLRGRDLKGSCKVGTRAKAAPELASAWQARLDRHLDLAWSLSGADARVCRDLAVVLGDFLEAYRTEYLKRGLISFDAMIILARDLLRDHVDVRAGEAGRFDHILIDEFQDTSPLQYEIAFFLCEADPSRPARDAYRAALQPGKLFIVGDWKQSIYRFRGADIEAFLRAVAKVEAEGGVRFDLQTNFRTVAEVLEPLDALFRPLFEGGSGGALGYRQLDAHRRAEPAATPCVEIWSVGRADDLAEDRRQAEAAAIAAWVGNGMRDGALEARHVAILMRSLNESDIYMQALQDAGVPAIVEGGKEFFERLEIALLLSLLRAITNPSDAVSLVAWLRSPAGAVPDRELHAFAAEQRAGWRWSISARADAGRFPRLAAALEAIGKFHREHREDPLDRIAFAALHETPLLLAMSASHQGAQKAANLRKAVGHIAVLAASGKLTRSEIIQRIEQEIAREKSEGDSPLADETVDAVRILTIHRSKGMEWPVVLLPDLARAAKPSQRPGMEAAIVTPPWDSASAALALRLGGVCTPGHVLRRELEAAQEIEESKRLFYVAATRARDRLVLVAGNPGKQGSWLDNLGPWGYSAGTGGFPDFHSCAGGRVKHLRIETVERQDFGLDPAGAPEEQARSVKSYLEAIGSLLPAETYRLRHPSDRKPSPPADPAELKTGKDAAPRLPSDAAARAAGVALHLLLELWDRREAGWLVSEAPRAARVAAARLETGWEMVRDRLLAHLESWRLDGTLERIAGAPALARELPMLYRDGQGVVWEGAIDLVTGTLERPEVVDYKFSVLEEEALEGAYEQQLQVYAAALRQALRLENAVPARIQKFGSAAGVPLVDGQHRSPTRFSP